MWKSKDFFHSFAADDVKDYRSLLKVDEQLIKFLNENKITDYKIAQMRKNFLAIVYKVEDE